MMDSQASTHPSPFVAVYAIAGKDAFLQREHLALLLGRIESTVDDLGPTRVNCDAELADVFDELRTMSLLGSRRVVIVEDADEFISKYRKNLEAYCQAPSQSGILVLLCESMPKNTNLYKLIQKLGGMVTCDPPPSRSLNHWIQERSRTVYHKELGEQATLVLRDLVGDSLGLLDAELAKLATLVGSRTVIQPSEVEQLSGDTRQEVIFKVADAVFDGNAPSALQTWHQVLATDRSALGRSLGGLAWSVRQLLEAHRHGTYPGPVADRVRRTKPSRVLELQQELLAIDLATKTGASTVDVAVERFIVRHATAAGHR